ncbi:hypothetical protein [uncultured Alistipes sp.]|uniref:hypothetical protein n=1 Tax=uncultured Alistipes sp. TaxID=538949 RepID=UPI002624EA50|nr:hypothetical protein [uncultured Alistipes sp.]
MERKALNRKPDLSPRKSFMLDADTKIEEIGITVRQQQQIANNKSLTEQEVGLHGIAAKILVNGQPIVYDDLMDGFTTEELEKITDFLFPDANSKSEKNG